VALPEDILLASSCCEKHCLQTLLQASVYKLREKELCRDRSRVHDNCRDIPRSSTTKYTMKTTICTIISFEFLDWNVVPDLYSGLLLTFPFAIGILFLSQLELT